MNRNVRDTDPQFKIDLTTRTISTECKKLSLVQGDRNSERFTFEVPQTIEGHEVANCDKVQIHYINIDQMTRAQSKGIYEAEDVEPNKETGTVTFSWLVGPLATVYQGSLHFIVRFVCYDDENNLRYAWSTAIHTSISVSSGIDNGEATAEDYSDILTKWEQELKANQVVSLEQTVTGDADGGENVWTATFGDGRTADLKVKNGQRGPAGLVGSIQTINGEPLHFFVGTHEQYDALSPEQQKNLFAIFTDDTTEQDLFNSIQFINEWMEAVQYGTFVGSTMSGIQVKYAKAAEFADEADVANNANWADEAGKATEAQTATEATKAYGAMQLVTIEIDLPKVSGDASYCEQRVNVPRGFYIATISFGDPQNEGEGVKYKSPLLLLGHQERHPCAPEIYRTVEGQTDGAVIIYGDNIAGLNYIKVRHYNKTKDGHITLHKYFNEV